MTKPADFPTFAPPEAKSFFPDQDAQTRDLTITIRDARSLRRRHKSETLNATGIANAAEHLQSIPKKGCALHCLMNANYGSWSLVGAVMRITNQTIKRLDLATLGFNESMLADLIKQIDAGRIGATKIIVSHFFRSNQKDGDLFDELAAALSSRGGAAIAVRSHAKIILMELADGTPLAIESSANLQSCRNLEQFTLFHDRAVLDFHRSWMDELHAAARKKAKTERNKTPRGKSRPSRPARRAKRVDRNARLSAAPKPTRARGVEPDRAATGKRRPTDPT